jgi:hypothetical protein
MVAEFSSMLDLARCRFKLVLPISLGGDVEGGGRLAPSVSSSSTLSVPLTFSPSRKGMG